ncbi:hypothetical protein [Melghirimyces profundicolus]|uniref:hypothetical protein n=1 Tax=Melghirimyces profundicolus TaxID=1242148 RepID=UPI0011B1D2FF|nr:hypothetical protein [Melghirimyces profundicolus]
MAYENGYQAESYLGDLFDQYKNDRLIFVKAQQLFTSYLSRPDWPHCLDDLDSSFTELLGINLWSLILFYERGYEQDELIKWPESLPKEFKSEFSSFCRAIIPICNQYAVARTQPLKLSNISQSLDGKGERIIRFVRMDGRYLDIQVEPHDIDEIINTLNNLGG